MISQRNQYLINVSKKIRKGEKGMRKNFSKILAMILSVGILATCCIVPMTASADAPAGETYEDYDVIEYADLLDTGNNHLTASGITLTAQNNIFHYQATSATHSVIYKFRYVAGASIYFQLFPGQYRSGDPFAYRMKNATTWEKRYSTGAGTVSVSTITEGTEIDIELARLQVATGDNAGKYYTYLKANGTRLFEAYIASTDIGSTDLNDSIQLNLDGSNNCMIKATPAAPAEQEPADALYYYYDEIDYNDLLENGSPLAAETQMGSKTFTYNRTSATYSAILKYRWKAIDTAKFQLSFDKAGSGVDYMFGVQLYTPGSEGHTTSSIRLRPGLDNAAWNDIGYDIETGAYYDIEFARLKVKNGTNAGKYCVYFKINDVLISESYVAANVVDASGNYTSNPGSASCTLSNEIYLTFWGGGGNDRIMHTPVPDTYGDYDEIYYSNLFVNGNAVPAERSGQGTAYTYNKTSSSGSAVLKLRWKAANAGTQFQMSFDKKGSDNAINYMFGMQLYTPGSDPTNYPNGYIWLRPGYGPKAELPEPIVTGTNYDIEFARLKVISGDNTGKYYMYFKMNGVLLAEDYVAANVVDASGNYTSNPGSTACSISNEMYITFWGGGGATITDPAYTETYDEYDEVTYYDMKISGNALPDAGIDLGTNRTITYDVTSPSHSAVLKFRWTAGSTARFLCYFDAWSGSAYPFCLAVKNPGYSGLGAVAGENGAWHIDPSVNSHIVQMSSPIAAGSTYDIEFARLKVLSGPKTGNYYVYLKVDGALIYGYYYDGVAADGSSYKNGAGHFTNEIRLNSSEAGNIISAIPIPETYEDYDEIGYSDLSLNGNPVQAGGMNLSGATVFHYNPTSSTGSAIFKYRWKIGSVQKFQMSFEKTSASAMAYQFGAWLSEPGSDAGFDNGRMWLIPGSGPQVNMPAVLATSSSHNVEFARLKVKTGRNTGKYYIYIKIDDTLIAESYVAANVVDANGDYTSNPGSTACNVNAGEIFFAFWGSEGNAIAPYKVTFEGQEGITCDFNDDGILNAADLAVLAQILLGTVDLGELPAGIADFNQDGAVDILDLIAFKKFLAPVNSYAKSGSLALGTQEHLLESNGNFVDNTKTAAYIADAAATLGASSYRLSRPLPALFDVTSTNGVTVDTTNMTQFKAMVAALKAQGINDILYVTDSFILPYGYSNPAINHNKTCPTPGTQDYEDWLTVNANAFALLAQEVPEIKFFEPFNEINLTTTGFEKPGIPWDAPASTAANYKYTVAEKAGIMADLCWYVSRTVKAVDPANQVTTPSISVGSHESIIEGTYLNALYTAIDSGAYPSFQTVGDKRADNYFTIVNIHAYPEYATTSSARTTKVNNIANDINNTIYSVMQAHNDGGTRVWLTETGVSTFGSRSESNAADLINKFLNKINTSLTYIDTVNFYKIADASASNGLSEPETKFGLFYSGDAATNRYAAKQTGKAVYSFFHNNTTDYSALTALAGRYA